MAVIARRPEVEAVRALLDEARLPCQDLTPGHVEDFLGAYSGGELEGVVGIERYGPVGLLRSLAVIPARQGIGLGKELVAAVETYARRCRVQELWVLTDTAEAYFTKLGYRTVPRASAPREIQATREFTTLCPESAVLMYKRIGQPTKSGFIRPISG